MGNQYSNLVFQPPEKPTYGDDLTGLIWVESDIGKIPIRFLEWSGAQGERAHFTLFMCGDNGSDLGNPLYEEFRDILHCDVCICEYPGFGLCPGKTSEKSVLEVVKAIFKWLTGIKGILSTQIIFVGLTLGTGPALALAHYLYTEAPSRHTLRSSSLFKLPSKKKSPSSSSSQIFIGIGGIMLISPMTSVLNVNPELKKSLRTSAAQSDMFENLQIISKIPCVIGILCAGADKIVPASHSKKLSVLCHHLWKCVVIENAENDVLFTDYEETVWKTVTQFLRDIAKFSGAKMEKKTNSLSPELARRRSLYVNTAESTVAGFLRQCGLDETQYKEPFLQAGYFSEDSLIQIDATDLDCIGVVDETHRAAVLKYIEIQKVESASASSTSDSFVVVNQSKTQSAPTTPKPSNSRPRIQWGDSLRNIKSLRAETPLARVHKLEPVEESKMQSSMIVHLEDVCKRQDLKVKELENRLLQALSLIQKLEERVQHLENPAINVNDKNNNNNNNNK